MGENLLNVDYLGSKLKSKELCATYLKRVKSHRGTCDSVPETHRSSSAPHFPTYSTVSAATLSPKFSSIIKSIIFKLLITYLNL